MRVQQLVLTGFKSFAKKSELSFPHPITAIVGPNGSGKSNVVEAIRFVLGEQSMKSMRGRAGADLIYNGSKVLAPLSRASVSITFDNKDRIFKLETDAMKQINVDFDTITIAREVFKDGSSTYRINGSDVRLKDVVQLLASVNIGSSGHHIISQGEADRILNASVRERREMIEDALGLKVYQYRIAESERKLERTQQNMKEVESLRREIAPHIKFLKKQVEKFHRARELRGELHDLYHHYLAHEAAYLSATAAELDAQRRQLEQMVADIDQRIQRVKEQTKPSAVPAKDTLVHAEAALVRIQQKKDELSRKLGRIEGILDHEKNKAKQSGERTIVISVARLTTYFDQMKELLRSIDLAEDADTVRDRVSELSERVQEFRHTLLEEEERSADLEQYEVELTQLSGDLAVCIEEEVQKKKVIAGLREELASEQAAGYAAEKEQLALEGERKELLGKGELLDLKLRDLKRAQQAFDEELQEGSILIGPSILKYKEVAVKELSRSKQEEQRKQLERTKIKLEELGGGAGGDDVLKEYEEVTQRDAFLERELEDIEKSTRSLETLIRDLKDELHQSFKTGLEKINSQFQEFFTAMFGGGRAFLSLVTQPQRRGDDSIEEEIEQGIDVNVSLPNKKAKDLAMLSGGERSLTSIALLFAISQVNPPPFLVLDETDAALDEANSRKYGDMLESLSTYSQLIVVTHNRETMSRAHVLFGITIGKDGASKLLSIKLAEAVTIAK